MAEIGLPQHCMKCKHQSGGYFVCSCYQAAYVLRKTILDMAVLFGYDHESPDSCEYYEPEGKEDELLREHCTE